MDATSMAMLALFALGLAAVFAGASGIRRSSQAPLGMEPRAPPAAKGIDKRAGQGFFWLAFAAILVALMILGAVSGPAADALCQEGEKGVRVASCNNYDQPCPSNVQGCEDGCTRYACVDQAGHIQRYGWVAN